MHALPFHWAARTTAKQDRAGRPHGRSLDDAARMGDSAMLKHVSSKGLAQGPAGLADRHRDLVPRLIVHRPDRSNRLSGKCLDAVLARSRRPGTGTPCLAGATTASLTRRPNFRTAITGTKPENCDGTLRAPETATRAGSCADADYMGAKGMRLTCTAPQDGRVRQGLWTLKTLLRMPKQPRLSIGRVGGLNCRNCCGFVIVIAENGAVYE